MAPLFLLAVFAFQTSAVECKPTAFPKSASYVKIKITPKGGQSQEVILNPISQKDGEAEFAKTQTLHVDGKTVQTISLSMQYKEINIWEKMDKIVPKDKYKPYLVPSIHMDVGSSVIQPNGFVDASGGVGGDSTSIPSRIGSSHEALGLQIEVVEILARDAQQATCGKRFEASAAEAACYEQKYTHKCLESFAHDQAKDPSATLPTK